MALAGALCFGDPRAKPADYPAHAQSAHVAIGAEYLVHSFSNGRQTFFVPDYLVVDTAVYPQGKLTIQQGHFQLRVNGTQRLNPVAPSMVGYSLQNPDFRNPGMAQQQPRFPGDPGGTRPLPPAQAPDPSQSDPQAAPESALESLTRTALPEGEFHSPQSGFLYFEYGGKIKKIKTLDLVYSDDAGELVVKLF